jgi:hypothetical protein
MKNFIIIAALLVVSGCKKEDSCNSNGKIILHTSSDTILIAKKFDGVYGSISDVLYPNTKTVLDYIPGKYYFEFGYHQSNEVFSMDTFVINGCDTINKFF